jgi:AcrR family transcriptional regulator
MTSPPGGRRADGSTAMVTGKITRDAVLATALHLIDRDGADALSMRRLAQALGCDPMTLYRHAPNKAALLDGVTEIVLAQLTRAWCRCWSPGRSPPRWGYAPAAPCATSRTSSPS